MSRFTSGLLAGSLVGAVGIAYMMSDGRTRRRVVKDSRKMARRAGDVFENVTDMMR